MVKVSHIVAAALAAVFSLFASAGAFAASAVSHPAPIGAKKAVEGSLVVAQRRGGGVRRAGRVRRGGRGRGRGAGVAVGIIAGAVGAAIIANEAARAEERRRRRFEDDDYDDRPRRRRASGGDAAMERCADEFRSFSWSDGTYQPFGDVPRRLCPYL